MEYGDLPAYLKRHENADRVKIVSSSLSQYRFCEVGSDALVKAVGIASGLSYLHTLDPIVVHGDLRAVSNY